MAAFDQRKGDGYRRARYAASRHPPRKRLDGTFLSDIVLQVLSFVAENERDAIRSRQAEGIAAAKMRGVKFGRPACPLPPDFHKIRTDWRKKRYTLCQAASLCGMKKGTFYAKVRRAEREEEEKKDKRHE